MNLCVVIPCFNHHKKLAQICQVLRQHGLPVIVVDDASNAETRDTIDAIAPQYQLEVVRHPLNQGKGGAVMSGMRKAHALGYTHALQVDSDGQHDLNDIATLIQAAKTSPDAVVSGQPHYDESIPKGRKYGRYITHFWVWIETLSFSIKDTMCGFRVYPLASCVALLDSVRLGKRMDFDIEILVRLYWRNVPVIFVPTKVTYPEDGQSHFQPLADNVRISWLHTRLFFGMLWRSPVLLTRKFST